MRFTFKHFIFLKIKVNDGNSSCIPWLFVEKLSVSDYFSNVDKHTFSLALQKAKLYLLRQPLAAGGYIPAAGVHKGAGV